MCLTIEAPAPQKRRRDCPLVRTAAAVAAARGASRCRSCVNPVNEARAPGLIDAGREWAIAELHTGGIASAFAHRAIHGRRCARG